MTTDEMIHELYELQVTLSDAGNVGLGPPDNIYKRVESWPLLPPIHY